MLVRSGPVTRKVLHTNYVNALGIYPGASVVGHGRVLSAYCYSCGRLVECSNNNESGSWRCPEGHVPNRQPFKLKHRVGL